MKAPDNDTICSAADTILYIGLRVQTPRTMTSFVCFGKLCRVLNEYALFDWLVMNDGMKDITKTMEIPDEIVGVGFGF